MKIKAPNGYYEFTTVSADASVGFEGNLLVSVTFYSDGLSHGPGQVTTVEAGTQLGLVVDGDVPSAERDMKDRGFTIDDVYGALTYPPSQKTTTWAFDYLGEWHLYMPSFLASELGKGKMKVATTSGQLGRTYVAIQFELPKTFSFAPESYVTTAGQGSSEGQLFPGLRKGFWKEAALKMGVVLNGKYEGLNVNGNTKPLITYPLASQFHAILPWTKYVMGFTWGEEVFGENVTGQELSAEAKIYIPNTYIDITATQTHQGDLADTKIREALEGGGTGTGLTEEQQVNKLPLSEQAILLYKLTSLSRVNKERRRGGALTEGEQVYDRFAPIDTNDPADLETIVNTLTSPDNMGPLFDKIRPKHLSAAIPRLRLFKLYNPVHPRMKDVRDRDKEPRVVVEYEFDEHLREFVKNEEGKWRTSILDRTLSTNTGVGVEAFKWDFYGTNQFEAERLVTANLRLRAQSINALEELRYSHASNNTPYKFSDLFIPSEDPKNLPFNKKKNRGEYTATSVSQREARILIEYGIDESNPVFNDRDGKEVKEVLKKLRLAINLVRTTYTLELRDDGSVGVDINFVGRLEAPAADPTFGNILPDASAGKSLRETNKGENWLEERARNRSSLEALQEHDNAKRRQMKVLQESRKPGTELSEAKKAMFDKLTAEVQKLTPQISELQALVNPGGGTDMTDDEYIAKLSSQLDRLELYRSIYRGLLKRDAIKFLSVDPRNIATNPLETANIACADVAENAAQIDIDIAASVDPLKIDTKALKTQKTLLGSIETFSQKMKGIIMPRYTSTHYRIPFIYFGDLVDTVLDNMYMNREDINNDIRTVLGPIKIRSNIWLAPGFKAHIQIDKTGKISVGDRMGTNQPSQGTEDKEQIDQDSVALELKRAEDIATAKEAQKNIAADYKENADALESVSNLADVPISFNLFLQWFSEKISNKGAYSYSLKAFLSDAIQSLIVSSLQADSTKIILPKQPMRLVNVTWDSPTNREEPCPLGFTHKAGKELRVELPDDNSATAPEVHHPPKSAKKLLTLADLKSSNKKQSTHQMPMGTPRLSGGGYDSDYMLIYAEPIEWSRKYAPNRSVDDGKFSEYQRDINDRVYHLESGRDVGMVKTISLSAMDIEGYEEMQIMNVLKTGKRPVKRVYQATVTLHGVTFFRPGQTVYINAAAYGSFRNLLKFGLCGYYTVRTASSRISSGEFVTELVCDFRATGEHTEDED